MESFTKHSDGSVTFGNESVPKEIFEWLLDKGIIYCGGDVLDRPECVVGYGKKFYNFTK